MNETVALLTYSQTNAWTNERMNEQRKERTNEPSIYICFSSSLVLLYGNCRSHSHSPAPAVSPDVLARGKKVPRGVITGINSGRHRRKRKKRNVICSFRSLLPKANSKLVSCRETTDCATCPTGIITCLPVKPART